MKLYCMNNTAGAIAILKEMEKNPDELMKGDFAEFPGSGTVQHEVQEKSKENARKTREKREE